MTRQDDHDDLERIAKAIDQDAVVRMVGTIRASFSSMFKATQVYEQLYSFSSMFKSAQVYEDLVRRSSVNLMRPYFITLQETVMSRIKEVVRSSQLINALDVLRSASTQVVDLVKKWDRATGILVELGWPPHGDLTTGELAWIVQVYDSKGPEDAASFVDDFMVNRYGEKELHRILERWSQRRWLQSRLPILGQIIEGHKKELYYLSVPTCFAQIEGIIAEGFGHKGRMRTKDYEQYLDKLLDTRLSGDQAMQEFMSRVVLVHFTWGSQLSSQFSRHAILHGMDTKYGTAENSLRSILLFDYLQGKFRYVSVGKGKSYHDPSCPIIRGKARRAIFDWEAKAEEAGLQACSVCLGRKSKVA